MRSKNTTKEKLTNELAELHRRIAELKKSEKKLKRAEEAQSGRIWVESQGKGKGSRFSFVLLMKHGFLEQEGSFEERDLL